MTTRFVTVGDDLTLPASVVVPAGQVNGLDAKVAELAEDPTSDLGASLSDTYVAQAAAPELIRDTMGTALMAGPGVTITPDDGADTITIASSAVKTALLIPGVSSSFNGPSAPDTAQLSVTGDIDIRVKATMAEWAAASTWPLVAKWGSGTGGASRSYFFALTASPAGAPSLRWVPPAGGNFIDGRASTSPTGFAAGQAGWVRVTLDVDNGAGGWTVTYYTSTDGVSWAQHSTLSGSGVTGIYDSAVAVEVGRADVAYPGRDGLIHEVQIRDGINGPLVGHWDGSWPHTRQMDAAGNVWTVNGTANAWMRVV